MTPLQKMQESRRRLLLKYGELAPIVLRLELAEETEGPIELMRTAYTDGKKLAFHPEFVNSLPNDRQCDTLQAHEAFHVALLHTFSTRVRWMAESDQVAFWLAADHVVNNILLEAGFEPINPWVCDVKYRGWTLESVFEDLKQQSEKQRGKGGFDQHLTPLDESKLSPQERADLERAKKEWKQALADVVTIAKQRGKLGAGLEKLVGESLESVVPWPRLVADHVTRRLGHDDWTWMRPSRRGRAIGVYLPSSYSLEVECVAFLFDTSGSMWDDPLLAQGFAEIRAGCRELRVKRLVLIEADVGVTREEEVGDSTTLSTEIKGGGGTSFVHALEAAAKYEPNLTIYFSDLMGEFPAHYDYPLLWVTRSANIEVPFGESLVIK